MHCDTLKQDNDSTVRGDGGSRVGEVRAGTTSPCPSIRAFATVIVRDPPNHTSSLRVKCSSVETNTNKVLLDPDKELIVLKGKQT